MLTLVLKALATATMTSSHPQHQVSRKKTVSGGYCARQWIISRKESSCTVSGREPEYASPSAAYPECQDCSDQQGMKGEHPRLARIDVDTIKSPHRTRVGDRAVRGHKVLLQHGFAQKLLHEHLVGPHVAGVQDGLVLGSD